MGKRLSPITLAEGNSKPKAKLPMMVGEDSKLAPLRLLEAVIFSTGVYASSRGGRVTIFNSDQIIIPSSNVEKQSAHHIEVFCKAQEIDQLSNNYGILVFGPENRVTRNIRAGWEKDDVEELSVEGVVNSRGFGLSFGSCSISWEILNALLGTFPSDRSEARLLLQTPLHFAMGLAIAVPRESLNKDALKVRDAFNKMANEKFPFVDPDLVGYTDLGYQSYYWDFGRISSYLQVILKIVEPSPEGEVARRFWGVNLDKNMVVDLNSQDIEIDNCLIQNSTVKNGQIKNSIVLDFQGDNVDIQDYS